MSKQKKKALVPTLRFPEFRDAGEWDVKELGGLCKIQTGKKDANEGAENGLYPFFTCAEKHIYSNSYSFNAEAILVAGNANVGQTKYYNGKFEAYQRTYVLTNFSGIDVAYLYTLLSANLRSALLSQVQSSAMSYIKLPMLQEYGLLIPPAFKEQQKIASCLSSIDDLITAQSQKVEALKTHKKGLMQQLFPREGETVPRLRFPEFRDAGEWGIKKVGDICDFVVPGRNKPTEFDGDIPWITTPDIEQNGLVIFSKKDLYITKNEANYVGSKIVPKNSIIISCAGDLGLVGIAGVDLIINQQLHAFIPKEDIYYKFLLYALTLQKPYMEKIATKTAIPYMNKDNCNSIPIVMPSIIEQQKIASCLSSIDELISAHSQKLDALKTHKKGLMQQLFPAADEVEA